MDESHKYYSNLAKNKKYIYFETRGMTAINLFGKCICPCVWKPEWSCDGKTILIKLCVHAFLFCFFVVGNDLWLAFNNYCTY